MHRNEAPAFQRTGRTSVGGGDAPTAFQRTGQTSLSGNEAWHARTTGDPTYQQPMVPPPPPPPPPRDDKQQVGRGHANHMVAIQMKQGRLFKILEVSASLQRTQQLT